MSLLLGKKPEEDRTSAQDRKEASERVSRIIGRYFTIKDIRFDEAGVYATVTMYKSESEKSFEALRKELKKISMYPRLVKSRGEWVIVVFPSPKKKKANVKLNIIMLILTLFTTIWAGAYIWNSRNGGGDVYDIFKVLVSPMDLLLGALTFALPLLLILGIHELGHYFTSRYYHVEASLPYFIPIPPIISPFGTFGALISMRENISNRKALVEIGAAGPIAGFVVAIPVTALGLVLTNTFPAEGAEIVEGAPYIVFNEPLMFDILEIFIPVGNEGMIFPTALAGWIGLFVTALNLFPVGQLDGGHIVRGLLGDSAKYVSYGVIATLIAMGLITGFITYIFFAVLILLLGGRHPPPLDDYSSLGKRQYLVAGLAVMMFILTFHPIPLETYIGEKEGIEVFPQQDGAFVRWDEPSMLNITVENIGSGDTWVTMKISYNDTLMIASQLNRTFEWDGEAFDSFSNEAEYTFQGDDIYVLSMGSLKRLVKGNSQSTFDIVLGCSMEREYISNGTLEFDFETDKGDSHTVDITLQDYDSYIYLERTRLKASGRNFINGSAYLFPGNPGSFYNMTVVTDKVEGEWLLGFQPLGDDSELFNSSMEDSYIELGDQRDNSTYLGRLTYSNNTEEVRTFRFSIELINYQSGENGGDLRLLFRMAGNGISEEVTLRASTEK